MTVDGYAKGVLRERDGIPLFNSSGGQNKVKGSLIYFQSGSEDAAYKRIVEIEPGRVYRWDKARVNGKIISNVLFGKREERGSTPLEDVEEWDGKDDPFFRHGLNEVKTILENNSSFKWDYAALFRLQMAYTFLWSIIERYAGLRYHLGNNVNQKILEIATEESFVDGLRKYVKSERVVYSASDLNKYTLDSSNPQNAIKYYYQVRSNAVHRGKAVVDDFDTMKFSLEELLAIFTDVLDSSFS